MPAGLNFDATGADTNGCTAADFPTGFTDTANLAAAPRVVCCTPTRDGASIVVVTAHGADANRASTDRARLSFTFTVVAPAAAIAWSLPPTLTEANLHGATLGVPLKQSAFAAGTGASGFALVTTVPDLSIARVSDETEGGTTATLALAFTSDWRGAGRPLAVKVLAARPTGRPGTSPPGRSRCRRYRGSRRRRRRRTGCEPRRRAGRRRSRWRCRPGPRRR